jgi:benzylsuccinate CoA-transferase BbsF subunit
MASISGYGAAGPEHSYVAYGQTIEAAAGLDAATGYAGGPPMACGAPIADHIAGMTAAGAILAAVERRRQTGEGCVIDLSMVDALVAMMPSGIIDFQFTGLSPAPHGNDHELIVPHGCYPCRGENRWIALAAATPAEWQALCAVLQPNLDVAELAPLERRRAARERVDAAIAAAAAAWDPHELQEQLRTAGVPATEVLDGYGLRDDVTMTEREYFTPIQSAAVGERLIPGRHALFSYLPPTLPRRAPILGEQTAEILGEVLGMSSDEIERLRVDSVLA